MEANETDIQKLITDVASKLDEIKSQMPISFNVYELCGVRHLETTHSSILAGLLGYNMNRKPLERFIHDFLDIELSEEDLNSASIKTEEWISIDNERRRVDIIIRIRNRLWIIIENKIFTDDHSQQLQAYSNWLKKQSARETRLVYLTLYGTSSTEGGPTDKCLSYKDDIRKWLQSCSDFSGLDEDYRCAFVQYNKFWEKWFMTEEVKKSIIPLVIANPASYDSAQQINKFFRDARRQLITETLQAWQDTKKESYICLKNAKELNEGYYQNIFFAWNHKVKFGFEFGKDFNDLYYGVIPEEGQDKVSIENQNNDDWDYSSAGWYVYKYIADKRVRYIGSNEYLCFDQETLFAVLDEAFNEMVEFLKQNEQLFGKQSELAAKQFEGLREQLEKMDIMPFDSSLTQCTEGIGKEDKGSTYLNGAKIGTHTFGISIHFYHVGYKTLIWENPGNQLDRGQDFLNISDAMSAYPELQKEFPIVIRGDKRFWYHKEIIPFDGIIDWLKDLQKLLKSLQ